MWVTNCQFYLLTQVKGAFFSLVFQRETSVTLNGPVEVSLDDRLRWFGSHFVSVIVCDLIIQFQWEQTTTTTTWRNPNVIWSGGQKEADTPGSCLSREGKRKKKKIKRAKWWVLGQKKRRKLTDETRILSKKKRKLGGTRKLWVQLNRRSVLNSN